MGKSESYLKCHEKKVNRTINQAFTPRLKHDNIQTW